MIDGLHGIALNKELLTFLNSLDKNLIGLYKIFQKQHIDEARGVVGEDFVSVKGFKVG